LHTFFYLFFTFGMGSILYAWIPCQMWEHRKIELDLAGILDKLFCLIFLSCRLRRQHFQKRQVIKPKIACTDKVKYVLLLHLDLLSLYLEEKKKPGSQIICTYSYCLLTVNFPHVKLLFYIGHRDIRESWMSKG
jgi:hypothetical protein